MPVNPSIDSAQLLPSSDILQALFSSVDDGIVVTDKFGKIIYANEAAIEINDDVNFPRDPAERLSHYSFNEELAQPLKLQDLPFFRALCEGKVKGQQLILNTDKGRKKRLVCNSRALVNSSSQKIGAVIVFHDKTSEYETEVHKSELEKERAKLLKINTELERFSAIAAHDLKSPLNSITQFVDLLQEELHGKIRPDQEELLDYISRAGGRLRNLIDDLLTFARAGNSENKFSTVDLNSIVSDVLSALRGGLKESGATIKVAKLPNVYADKVTIAQLIQNLFGNSIKYRSARPLEVTFSANAEGDFWHFVVSDNGIGIKKSDLESAFELFKRLEGSAEAEGTGLGLPICKRIVESHGGKIWIEAEQGLGTSVHFTLPDSEQNLN